MEIPVTLGLDKPTESSSRDIQFFKDILRTTSVNKEWNDMRDTKEGTKRKDNISNTDLLMDCLVHGKLEGFNEIILWFVMIAKFN